MPYDFITMGSFFDVSHGPTVTAIDNLLSKLNPEQKKQDPLASVVTLMPILMPQVIAPYKAGRIASDKFVAAMKAEIKQQLLTEVASADWCTDAEFIAAWNAMIVPTTDTLSKITDCFKRDDVIILTDSNPLQQETVAFKLKELGFDYDLTAGTLTNSEGKTLPVFASYKLGTTGFAALKAKVEELLPPFEELTAAGDEVAPIARGRKASL